MSAAIMIPSLYLKARTEVPVTIGDLQAKEEEEAMSLSYSEYIN